MNKRVLSPKEIQSRRQNGLKSRGPATERGKAASARNAIRHEILCNTIVLDGESADLFVEQISSLQAFFEPSNPVEIALVETLAVCRWRQMRIWGLEKAGLILEIQKQSDGNQTLAAEDPATRTYRALCSEAHHFEVLSRYETRFDRQYNRTLHRLNSLRQRRPIALLNEAA